MTVSGKVALITGAGSGIGKATAEHMHEAGALVVAGIIAEEQHCPTAGYVQRILDVRSQSQWDDAISECRNRFGGIDILVNNAGILIEGNAEQTSDADWDLIFDINLKGAFRGCRTVIPEMRRRGGGAIINLASIDALTGAIGHVAYSAAKGGVTALTRSLATDHAEEGIRVNAVGPGVIRTPMTERYFQSEDYAETIRSIHALNRWGEPPEVAKAIAYLASDDASFVTGTTLLVDGGWTAGKKL